MVRNEKGLWSGIEAVIDKDLASSQLARELKTDWLLMLTDVDAVYSGWGTAHSEAIREITPSKLAEMSFQLGSMAPKVTAASTFVLATGGRAGIGRMQDAAAILAGEAGTTIASAIR